MEVNKIGPKPLRNSDRCSLRHLIATVSSPGYLNLCHIPVLHTWVPAYLSGLISCQPQLSIMCFTYIKLLTIPETREILKHLHPLVQDAASLPTNILQDLLQSSVCVCVYSRTRMCVLLSPSTALFFHRYHYVAELTGQTYLGSSFSSVPCSTRCPGYNF